MKAEFKKLWVDALRSGEYDQAKHKLTKVDQNGNKSHCCLGLLCDLVKDKIDIEVVEGTTTVTYDGNNAVLPPSIYNQIGLSTDGGIPVYKFFIDSSRQGEPSYLYDHGDWKNEWVSSEAAILHLASLNDTDLTFSQIADIIDWAEPAEGGE